jgi:hypothetical protein
MRLPLIAWAVLIQLNVPVVHSSYLGRFHTMRNFIKDSTVDLLWTWSGGFALFFLIDKAPHKPTSITFLYVLWALITFRALSQWTSGFLASFYYLREYIYAIEKEESVYGNLNFTPFNNTFAIFIGTTLLLTIISSIFMIICGFFISWGTGFKVTFVILLSNIYGVIAYSKETGILRKLTRTVTCLFSQIGKNS